MGFDPGVLNASLRVLGLGMSGILATTVIFIALTYILRRAFPAPPGGDKTQK